MHHYLLAAVCEWASPPPKVKNKVNRQRERRSARPAVVFIDLISFLRIFTVPPAVAAHPGRWRPSCRNVKRKLPNRVCFGTRAPVPVIPPCLIGVEGGFAA